MSEIKTVPNGINGSPSPHHSVVMLYDHTDCNTIKSTRLKVEMSNTISNLTGRIAECKDVQKSDRIRRHRVCIKQAMLAFSVEPRQGEVLLDDYVLIRLGNLWHIVDQLNGDVHGSFSTVKKCFNCIRSYNV